MLGAPPPRRAPTSLIHPSYCLIRGSPRAAYTWAHHAERTSERPDRARPAGVSEPGEWGSMPEASPHRATANDRGAERPDPGASAAIGRRDTGCRPWCARSVAAGCRVRSGFAVPLEDPRRRTAILWPLCSGPSNRVGTREKKSQGPGFGVEDRLPRQKPPTLGVQGAPPAPRTTVSGAARSDLSCVLRPLRVRGGCHGFQARKEPPAEGENVDARAAAEHAPVGCAAVRPRWGSGGLIAATPSGRAQKACAGPRLGCHSWMMGGGPRARCFQGRRRDPHGNEGNS